MKEITVSAKTLDDAITEASIQLGVSSDQMEYDVIEKGSTRCNKNNQKGQQNRELELRMKLKMR